MAKKGKKFDQDTNDGVVQTIENPNVELPSDEPKAPLIPRNPSLYLEHSSGVQFKFDRRELPKKAAVAGQITIDGEICDFQVTANKGWAKSPDVTLEYIWVCLPSGITGYITMDYTVPAADFIGAEFTVGEGKANRDNPDRVGDEAKETARKAAAALTLAAKAAAKAVATVEDAPTEQ